ncbi:ABC transporter transmembrane domain-containing protein [Jiella marina]|uniref:ABC transporter transmembrane domain-containing protein n=1 Tax=Jiella sp. LLJ827 TaxID=2917712 RepID=UPI0021013E69|nr:ABC transporter transmembrane domain-containing protein [Jiella sp. LLJ827]MCQ0989356.1 ABC transporter ATP-binding protein [Jiella sp. LLJ827]
MTITKLDTDIPQGGSPDSRPDDCGKRPLPPTLSGTIWRCGVSEQVWLVILSAGVFLVNLAPLELQRRIVNQATQGGNLEAIFRLAAIYAGTAIALGLLKLGMNVYRGRVSENAVRWLRSAILDRVGHLALPKNRHIAPGVEVSLVLSEVEPIGNFVGVSLSEPILKGGILVSTFAYLAYLEPLMALVALLVLSPQFVFVPLMQSAINRRVGKRIATLRALSSDIIAEPLSGATKALGAEIATVFQINMGIFKLKYSMNFLMNLMHHVGVAAILAVGGYYAVIGAIEVGTIVAFISGLAQINNPWGDLVHWYRELKVTQTKYGLITKALSPDGWIEASDVAALSHTRR